MKNMRKAVMIRNCNYESEDKSIRLIIPACILSGRYAESETDRAEGYEKQIPDLASPR